MRVNNEKSVFLKVVGDTPKLRILDFLLTFQKFDYSLTDIAKNANVSYSNLMLIWPEFVKIGLVEKTRMVGKAKMYKLNDKNPIVQELSRLQWSIAKFVIHKKLELEGVQGKRKVELITS
jgi:DNA-binding transcriptional ArsR family regulator